MDYEQPIGQVLKCEPIDGGLKLRIKFNANVSKKDAKMYLSFLENEGCSITFEKTETLNEQPKALT